MTFKKSLLKKTTFMMTYFQSFINFWYLTKFYHVDVFDGILKVLWIFFTFYTKVYFLCLLLSLRPFTVTEILKWVILFFVFFLLFWFFCTLLAKRSTTNRVPKSYKSKMGVIYMQSWKYVHHSPKCMSCHKTIVVITGRAHCFHDCI